MLPSLLESAFSSTLLLVMGAMAAVLGVLTLVGRVPLRYNLRNLIVRWRTTLLTGGAFAVVVALLVVMMAFVDGMYRLTQGSGHPENVLVLSDGTTDETFSNLGFSDVGDIENVAGVARENDRPLCSRETYLVVNQPVADPQPGRPKRRFLQVRGLDDPALSARIHELDLFPGSRWFSDAGVQAAPGAEAAAEESRIEAVIGEGIARELGRDRSPAAQAAARNAERLEVGDEFLLGGRRWVVVGVLRASGSTFDSEIWSKRSLVAPLFGKNTYSSLVLRAEDAAGARRLAEFFRTEYKKAAVQAQVETEYFASLAATNQQFLFSIIVVTCIMAIGGVFGVMNTMFAAVSMRVRDIGVLRILGFARWQVLTSFLLESLLLAFLGGGIGCLLGASAHGWRAAASLSNQQGGGKFVTLEMIVSGETLALGLGLALAMGLLGGLIPSVAAMRARPLEALRS